MPEMSWEGCRTLRRPRNFVAKCKRQLVATKIKPALCSGCLQSHMYTGWVEDNCGHSQAPDNDLLKVPNSTTTLHRSSGVLVTHNTTTLSIGSHIGKWLPIIQPCKCITNWRQNASNLGNVIQLLQCWPNLVATMLVKQHHYVIWNG